MGFNSAWAITLAMLALEEYVTAEGAAGYALALLSVLALLIFRRQRRLPAPLIVIGLGFVYAAAVKLDNAALANSVGLSLPSFHAPT